MPWWLWVLAAVLAAVTTITLLGGFSEVPVEKLPVIELGAAQPGNEVTTTITGVYLTDRAVVTGYELDEGVTNLVVTGTLLNTTDRPSILGQDLVRVLVEGVINPDDDDPDRAVELRNGSSLGFLQPGLPVEVAWVWKVSTDSVEVGDDIIVGVFERYKIEYDPVFGDDAFTSAQPIARIITTVGASR